MHQNKFEFQRSMENLPQYTYNVPKAWSRQHRVHLKVCHNSISIGHQIIPQILQPCCGIIRKLCDDPHIPLSQNVALQSILNKVQPYQECTHQNSIAEATAMNSINKAAEIQFYEYIDLTLTYNRAYAPRAKPLTNAITLTCFNPPQYLRGLSSRSEASSSVLLPYIA